MIMDNSTGSMKKNVTILIIDDEEVSLKSCRKILESEGYEVRTVQSGIDGLELIKSGAGDAVIVDMKMPEVSGMEILKEVKNHYPEKPVIMITGFSSIQSAVEAIKLGAFDYVPKPFTPDELSIVVKNAVEKKKMLDEINYLRTELYEKYKINNIIGVSKPMQEVFRLVQKIAETDSTVLIFGDSGTGKEVIAKAIHLQSNRNNKKFVPVDCSALSPNLMESELFGHIKGSFTGATAPKKGLFEVADGGTLFLDEISNISLDIQAKLLRVLETREYKPVGGAEMKKVDIRLISATNINLQEMVDANKFRNDLFYRLNVMPLNLPPLKDRKGDIPLLANSFLKQYAVEMKKKIAGFSNEALYFLENYDWPGNVRELKNTVERLVITVDDPFIDVRHLENIFHKHEKIPQVQLPKNKEELYELKRNIKDKAIAEVEKSFIFDALERNNWNVSKAARETGFQRSNFHALMKKYDISSHQNH